MRDTCNEIRQRIADSIGRELAPAARDEIERHCAECEACRAYREHLLRDDGRLARFAASGTESIRRVREGAIEKVRAAGASGAPESASEPSRARAPRASGIFARFPRLATVAAAAAAVVVAFVAIDFIRGAHNGAVPAFAAVQEKMQKAESVVYRARSWNQGQWTVREEGRAKPHINRRDFADSTTVFEIYRGGSVLLVLWPTEKRALMSRVEYQPDKYDSYDQQVAKQVDFLATWYKAKGFSFARKERLNGKSTAVYEKFPKAHDKETRMTAWVDLDTEMPVRFEIVAPRPSANSGHYKGLRLSDFQTESSKKASWIEVKEGDPVVILDNFRWSASVDTSYFSTVPPAGYSVQYLSRNELMTNLFGSGAEDIADAPDTCRTRGRATSEDAVSKLSTWLSLSGNVFPDELEDLTDSTKVNRLLIAKYRRGGDPAEEFRAALRTRHELYGLFPTYYHDSRQRPRIDIHYTGKGAVLGDSKRIVCWIEDGEEPPCPKRSGNGPYYMIYGDLRIAASPTPPVVKD